MAKRFTRIRFTRKRLFESVLSKSWCTGEDSNLRSSQGAADLQSAAINHSATCAEMPECPATHSVRQPKKRAGGGAEGRDAHRLARRRENQDICEHTSASRAQCFRNNS